LERRAAIRRRRRDALPPVVERVLDALATLTKQGLDCLHLGVRCPEDPDPISHLSPPSSSSPNPARAGTPRTWEGRPHTNGRRPATRLFPRLGSPIDCPRHCYRWLERSRRVRQ